MRETLAITLNQFRLFLKSKGSLATMFGMPLLLTFLFGVAFTPDADSDFTRLAVAVVDGDGTFASERLVTTLGEQPLLNVQLTTADEAAALVAHQRALAIITIPAGFQATLDTQAAPTAELMMPPGSTNDLAINPAVQRAVGQVAADYRLAKAAGGDLAVQYQQVREQRAALAVTVRRESAGEQPARDSRFTDVNERSMGFTIVFVAAIAFTASGAFLKERQEGTWGRLLSTPVGRGRLILGYLLSFFLLGLFQFSILVVVSSLLFGTHWGPWLPLFTLGSAFILCASGLGLLLAGLAKSLEQQRTLGTIVVQAAAMLGGCYWPLDIVGDTMKTLGYFTPHAWAMDGLREVMLRGSDWGAIAVPLAVLLAMAVAFTSVGVMRIRFE